MWSFMKQNCIDMWKRKFSRKESESRHKFNLIANCMVEQCSLIIIIMLYNIVKNKNLLIIEIKINKRIKEEILIFNDSDSIKNFKQVI